MLGAFFKKTCIKYIHDSSDWVICDIGNSLHRELKDKRFCLASSYKEAGRKDIIHFSTRYAVDFIPSIRSRNKIVLTYFHGDDSETELLGKLAESLKYIDIVHTSCEITKSHLIRNGVPEERIVKIPIGIDVNRFNRVSEADKISLRKEFDIPDGHLVVGSFQKDGNGWADGNEPKLIKGPDLFCDSIEIINKEYPVFVVLTGPARGYVRNRLDKAGIKYIHRYLSDSGELNTYYALLDLYLVASRLEGGPRAVMECMAAGVPVISSKVGMAPEVIEHGKDGYLVDTGDIAGMAEFALKLHEDAGMKKKLIVNGLNKVKRYDYSLLAIDYMDKIYAPLLK